MGINSERDIEANLQIGPTDQGMVRLFIEAQGLEIPMDFDPEEAEELSSPAAQSLIVSSVVAEESLLYSPYGNLDDRAAHAKRGRVSVPPARHY